MDELLEIVCSNCRWRYRVVSGAADVGRTVRCPHCGRTFAVAAVRKVPAESADAPPAPTSVVPLPEAPRPRAAAAPRSSPAPIGLLIVVAVLLVAGAAAWLAYQPNESAGPATQPADADWPLLEPKVVCEDGPSPADAADVASFRVQGREVAAAGMPTTQVAAVAPPAGPPASAPEPDDDMENVGFFGVPGRTPSVDRQPPSSQPQPPATDVRPQGRPTLASAPPPAPLTTAPETDAGWSPGKAAWPPAPPGPPGRVLLDDSFAAADGRWEQVRGFERAQVGDGRFVFRSTPGKYARCVSAVETPATAEIAVKFRVSAWGEASGSAAVLFGLPEGDYARWRERGYYRVTYGDEAVQLFRCGLGWQPLGRRAVACDRADHVIRIVADGAGAIAVYFDDMATPAIRASVGRQDQPADEAATHVGLAAAGIALEVHRVRIAEK